MYSVASSETGKTTGAGRSLKSRHMIDETPAFGIGQKICFSIFNKHFVGEVYLHVPPNFSVQEALQGVPRENLFAEEDRSIFCRLLVTLQRNGKTFWFAPLMVDCHPFDDGGDYERR